MVSGLRKENERSLLLGGQKTTSLVSDSVNRGNVTEKSRVLKQ